MGKKQQGSGYAWAVLIGACMMSASMGVYVATSQIYPAINSDLGINIGLLTMSMAFSAAGMTVTSPIAGKLLKKVNTRVLLTVCSIVAMGCIGACSLCTEVWHWYVLCTVMGLFAPPVFLLAATVLVANWFVQKKGFSEHCGHAEYRSEFL